MLLMKDWRKEAPFLPAFVQYRLTLAKKKGNIKAFMVTHGSSSDTTQVRREKL